MIKRNIDMAYAAGIMDGDGSFCLIKQKSAANPLYYPFLQFANRRKEIIDFLNDQFGGNMIEGKKHICKDGSEGSTLYHWRIRSFHNVKPVLESLIPFLKVKKERAECLMEFINLFPFERGKEMSHEKLLEKEKYYLKMMQHNDATSFNNIISKKLAKENTTDPIFWSYIAGLIDTDGSFSVKKQISNKGTQVKNARYLPVISISMCDTKAINYLRENCNLGKLYIPKNKACSNGFHYQYGIYTKSECIEFLKRVIPYLRAKQKNAQVLLDFCEKSENTKYCKAGISQEELAFRDKCYQQLVHLNKYGVYKFPLIVLEPLTDNAEGNKEQAGQKPCSLNAVSEETSNEDAVL